MMNAIANTEPPPIRRVRPDVPEALERIVTKALQKTRADRYATTREMLQDLEALSSAGLQSGAIATGTTLPERRHRPGAFIAALQAIDINNLYGDSHTFALAAGFGQNSQFTIAGNVLNAGPSFAGGLGATFDLRIIVTDSTSFTATQDVSLAVVDVVRTVVINEVHYNGDANVVRDEFVELYNPSDDVIDISQWRVRGGVDFFFPANTFLAPGSYVVVAEDPVTRPP